VAQHLYEKPLITCYARNIVVGLSPENIGETRLFLSLGLPPLRVCAVPTTACLSPLENFNATYNATADHLKPHKSIKRKHCHVYICRPLAMHISKVNRTTEKEKCLVSWHHLCFSYSAPRLISRVDPGVSTVPRLRYCSWP
jgi:hypothetical protein